MNIGYAGRYVLSLNVAVEMYISFKRSPASHPPKFPELCVLLRVEKYIHPLYNQLDKLDFVGSSQRLNCPTHMLGPTHTCYINCFCGKITWLNQNLSRLSLSKNPHFHCPSFAITIEQYRNTLALLLWENARKCTLAHSNSFLTSTPLQLLMNAICSCSEQCTSEQANIHCRAQGRQHRREIPPVDIQNPGVLFTVFDNGWLLCFASLARRLCRQSSQ